MSASLSFKAIGTAWTIDIVDELSADSLRALETAVRARVEKFEQAYSRFRKDSIVADIARSAGTRDLPVDAEPMMRLYREMYDLTHGLMTPLIGVTISDAGYDASYSLVPKKEIRKPRAWDEVMEYRAPTLVTKEPVMLDFGAIGKGYCIDIVAGLLRAAGIRSFIVEAGGDMAHQGGEPMRVGLEDPTDPDKMVGIVTVANASVCGSAGNRRAWDKYHHVMNPNTATSPRHILALWTVAETTALADALATALFFADPVALRTKFSFEYALLYADHTAEVSTGFPGKLFGDKAGKKV
ncbi:MAG: FAD:protein FMN transferase [Candidatus Paceibacterota bacterium]|jgi:thiamine biosynthesis lipoprotein